MNADIETKKLKLSVADRTGGAGTLNASPAVTVGPVPKLKGTVVPGATFL